MRRLLSAAATASLLLGTVAIARDDAISYPADYRSTYTNYLSMDRTQNHDQTIRLFGNDLAMQGPGEDGKLPYGSVLVAEIYKAKLDAEGNVYESPLG